MEYANPRPSFYEQDSTSKQFIGSGVIRAANMLPLETFHLLHLRISFKLLLFLWVFTRYNEVDGVPTQETVTKARCYANCLTKVLFNFN